MQHARGLLQGLEHGGRVGLFARVSARRQVREHQEAREQHLRLGQIDRAIKVDKVVRCLLLALGACEGGERLADNGHAGAELGPGQRLEQIGPQHLGRAGDGRGHQVQHVVANVAQFRGAHFGAVHLAGLAGLECEFVALNLGLADGTVAHDELDHALAALEQQIVVRGHGNHRVREGLAHLQTGLGRGDERLQTGHEQLLAHLQL